MKFQKFLQLGVVSVVALASLTNAVAAPTDTLLNTPQFSNTEVVQMIKQNVSKDDLTYIVKNGRAESNDRAERVYNKINNLITEKYGSNKLDAVKNELNDTLKEIGGSHIKVSYSYAMPKDIIDEVVKEFPDIRTNDSSRASNGFDVSSGCDVSMNLAIDNKGRLFESSELAALSTEQISKLSDKEIMATLKETLGHEVSHCLLQEQMKDPNFALKFSDSYAAKNPTIVKHLNEKILEIKQHVAEKKEYVNSLNLMTMVNFLENFADVNSGFAKMGEHPTAESIKEAKEQLLNVARYRETSDLNHQTQYAVQYALDKIDIAAQMNPEQRTVFAKEIASDSLMNNMQLALKGSLGSSSTGVLATYLVNGITILPDGSTSESVGEDKEAEYDAIKQEIVAMKVSKPAMGTLTQELKSYKDLVAQYTAPQPEPLQNEKIAQLNPESFNFNVCMKLREKYLKPDTQPELKVKPGI